MTIVTKKDYAYRFIEGEKVRWSSMVTKVHIGQGIFEWMNEFACDRRLVLRDCADRHVIDGLWVDPQTGLTENLVVKLVFAASL